MHGTDAPFWVAFGDIHDDITLLDAVPELEGAGGVIVTGDITLGGGVRQAERVLAPIAGRSRLLFAQIGNMDRAEVTDWLEKKGWNLHARARELFPGVMALGVGCSPFTPFGTPSEYPEARLAEWMDAALAEAAGLCPEPDAAVLQMPRLVLVAHTPPLNTACDRLTNGQHVGSTAVRAFIETHQPDLCLCGHIHESRGEDRIGRTQVVNPGTLSSGGYAVISQREVEGELRVVAQLKLLP